MKLNIKKGDRLLVDVQDEVIVLVPQPKRYSEHLAGLHKAVRDNIDAAAGFIARMSSFISLFTSSQMLTNSLRNWRNRRKLL